VKRHATERPNWTQVLAVLAGMVVIAAVVAFALWVMLVAFLLAGSS
jgi:fatty acid desaturase